MQNNLEDFCKEIDRPSSLNTPLFGGDTEQSPLLGQQNQILSINQAAYLSENVDYRSKEAYSNYSGS